MEKKMMKDFIATVVSALPCEEFDLATMQNWILNPSDLTDVLREALMPMSKKQSDKLVHSSATIVAKYGYTVEKNDDVQPSQFEARNLKFNPILRKGDGNSINSKTMRQRAKEMKGNLGLVDGENLRIQMNNSKKEFEHLQCKYIVLPGTLLRSSGGGLRVAYLCWVGDSWEFSFRWLDSDWDGDGQFACGE